MCNFSNYPLELEHPVYLLARNGRLTKRETLLLASPIVEAGD
jgi:hypothetical protein